MRTRGAAWRVGRSSYTSLLSSETVYLQRTCRTQRPARVSEPLRRTLKQRVFEHLAHLREYIERDNPNAANRIASALLEAVERFAQLPNLGRPGRRAGTRELVLPGTPYIITYRPRGDRLEVVGVFYGRQECPKHL